MNGTWVGSAKACSFFGVTSQTLRRWADSNNVEYKRTVGGHRLYKIDSGTRMETNEKVSYIYIRVSSSKQKDDLERQAIFMQDKFPSYTLIKDIGSGLNFKRRGLLKLMELSNKGLVKEIVVASKDRLCRFGFELIKWQLFQNNTELVVLEQNDRSPEEEFTEDILAILQVFACRWNGKRKYTIKNKKNNVIVDVCPEKTIGNVET